MENLPQKLFTVSQAAERLNVSAKTLRRWDKKGALTPLRTAGNQRRYTLEQINNYKSPLVVPSLRPEILVTSRDSSTSVKYLRPVLTVLILCAIAGLTVFLQGKSKNLLCRFKSPLSKLDITASCQNPLPIVSQNKTLPMILSGEDVLSEKSSSSDFVFNVNIPANFKEGATFNHDISAPNIINSITAGSGITVSGSRQNPTIANSGVLSLQGSTGALSLTAGSGISISGLTITNSGITSLTAGSGISVSGSTITNSDTGSGQKIFKTISVSGQSDIAVGSNTDTLTFASGTGITLTTDATNKKVTVTGVGGDLNVSGWTDNGTTVWLTTSTDNVGIGTSSPAYKLDLAGTLGVSGIAYFGGNVGIGTTRPTSTLYVTGTQTVTDAVTFGSTLAVTGTSSLNAINNNSGGITNAGPVTGATGLTSSGTITFSGLSTGIVHANFNGVLSSSAVDLTNGDVTGTLPVTSGGTNLTSYLKGDLIYASAINTLANLGIGGSGQVLTVSSGVPAWATAVGSEFCPTCLINNPGSTQTVTPTNENATGLSIKQASGGLVDIFNVTSFDGATKYFKVNSSGNVIVASLGIGSSGTLTSSALTTQRTWTFPNATGNICLDTGNCSGIGSNLGGSGTANYITRWNAQYVLENSSIYDNGNIGLGTTNPTSKLYVAGSMYATGSLSIGSSFGVTGLADFDSTLSVAGAVDFNSTLGVTGDTTLSSALGVTGNITSGGVLKINGLANSWILGNMGVGISNPAYKLDVSGTLGVSGTAYFASNVGIGTISPSSKLAIAGGVGIGTTSVTSVYHSSKAAPDGGLIVEGNVGIGTTRPSNRLEIANSGNFRIINSIGSSFFATDQSANTIHFGNNSGTRGLIFTMNVNRIASSDTVRPIYLNASGSDDLQIMNDGNVGVGGNPGSAKFYVNGNVGIGTTLPTQKLDVNGNINVGSSVLTAAIKISGGAQNTYILQSDASGNATWVAPNAAGVGTTYSANNGLTLSSGLFKLGGTLSQLTSINLNSNNFGFYGTGNVGIGTTSPAYKFEINDLSNGTNNYLASINNGNTGASAGGMYIRVDGTGNILNLNYAGSDIFTVNSTQTTIANPTNFTSSGDVSIAYDLNFTNPTASYIKSNAPLYLESGKSYNSDDLTLRTYNAGNIILESASLWADGTNVGIGNTSPIATLHTIGTGIFSGNVGIGTTALSSYALNVNGNLNVGGTGILPTLKLSGAFLDSANQPGSANMLLQSTGTGTTWVSATGIGGTYAAGNGLTLAGSQFKLGGALTENTRLNIGNTEVMYFSTGGNIGIGTTTPGAKLDIEATYGTEKGIRVSRGGAIAGSLWNDSDTGVGGILSLYSQTNENVRIRGLGNSWLNGGNIGIGNANPLNLLSVGTNPALPYLAVTSAGNVGIGTTSPSSKLAIRGGVGIGTTSATSVYHSSKLAPDGGMIIEGNVGIGTTNPGYNFQVVVDASNEGHVDSVGAWARTSDVNFKKNISDLESSLDKVMALRPIKYDPLTGPTNQIGFIAQEVQNIYPQFVSVDPNSGRMGLAYESFAPVLIKAIQEQEDKISALSEEIRSQSAKIDILKTDSLTASQSASLGSVGLDLDNPDATVSGTLMVLGKSTFGEVGITGQIISGVLSINGLDDNGNASISTLSGPLKLQANALGNLEIMDGQVLIDTKGNLVVQGTITAKKYNVDESDVLSASIGEGMITAGLLETLVETTVASGSSRIFVTAKDSPAPLAVTKQKQGSFKVIIEKALTKDLKFSWWIIN